MRRHLATALAGAALVLAACGGTSSSATKFDGDERAVADVVEEIQEAAAKDDSARICRDLIVEALRKQIESGGQNCTKELELAIDDVDDYELEVVDVTVSGTTATAKVESADGTEDRTDTLEFTKEQGRWKATSLGGA